MTTITNCYTRAASTSAIALRETRITCAAFIASRDFFLRNLFNVGAGRASRNTLRAENRRCRFGRMHSRSNLTGLFENWRTKMPHVGDVRFIVEMIDMERYEKLARARGWDGGEGMLDYAENHEAAHYSEHKTLPEAEAAARAWLATGKDVFGCCIIDRQVYERFDHDMPPAWENHESYEVAADGGTIKIAA